LVTFLTFFIFKRFFKNLGKVHSGKQINKKHFQNNRVKSMPARFSFFCARKRSEFSANFFHMHTYFDLRNITLSITEDGQKFLTVFLPNFPVHILEVASLNHMGVRT